LLIVLHVCVDLQHVDLKIVRANLRIGAQRGTTILNLECVRNNDVVRADSGLSRYI
jgi:hypothetical protein